MVHDLTHSIAFALPHICEQYPHAQGPQSPINPAYVYTAVILESLGKESHVGDVWFYLAERFTTEEDQMVLARRLREGLLKASVLVGFPRVSLGELDWYELLISHTPGYQRLGSFEERYQANITNATGEARPRQVAPPVRF